MPEELKTTQTSGEPETTVAPQVDLKDYVPVDDFRKFQSKKDREVAEAQARLAAQAQELDRLQTQMEQLIADPAARAKFQQERQMAELQRYKVKEAVQAQRRQLAERWGVPEEILRDIEEPGQMTAAALDWLKKQAEAVAQAQKPNPKETEVQETEEAGGHKAALSPGTTPSRSEAAGTQIDKQIQDLRVIAQKGGSAGVRARADILKLEAQRQRGTAPRARV